MQTLILFANLVNCVELFLLFSFICIELSLTLNEKASDKLFSDHIINPPPLKHLI